MLEAAQHAMISCYRAKALFAMSVSKNLKGGGVPSQGGL